MARKLPEQPDGATKEARARGAALPAPDYRPSPPPKNKKRGPWKSRKVLVIAALWLLFAGGVVLSYWFSQLPDTNNLLAYDPGKDVTLLDAKSRMIARRGITQGQQVKLGELPPYVGNA